MLRMLSEQLPDLEPEMYGSHQPINKPFNRANPDVALEEWEFSFLWKRKRPAVYGAMFHGSAQLERPFHTTFTVRTKPQNVDASRLIHFTQRFAEKFHVDLGLIHVLTKPEVESKRRFGVSTFTLNNSLPNLYWATVFGTPYVNLFGRNRLLSTPAAVVKTLTNDTIYIQLTDDLMDTHKNVIDVETARRGAKAHLNTNAFYDCDQSPNFTYRRPVFHISQTGITR